MTSGDVREMTAKEQAALDAHIAEESARYKAERKPTTREEIAAFFRDTPAIEEARRVAMIAAKQRYSDMTAVEIRLPKSTIEVLKLIERDRATAAKGKAAPVKKLIADRLINDVQMEVNTLITNPLSYRYYRQVWNKVCDMHHAPEHKIPEDPPEATEPPKAAGQEGPF